LLALHEKFFSPFAQHEVNAAIRPTTAAL
jgi:hypothetical protein